MWYTHHVAKVDHPGNLVPSYLDDHVLVVRVRVYHLALEAPLPRHHPRIKLIEHLRCGGRYVGDMWEMRGGDACDARAKPKGVAYWKNGV